jgi:monovalent cation/proton antiporter MnhG/PhaG subunit
MPAARIAMADLAAAFLLVVGSIVVLLAAIGVARFPDAFMRMHAATKAGVIGTGLCILGAALGFGDQATWVKATVIVVFLLVTTPIASHVLGRAAWRASARIVPHTRLSSIEAELPRVIFDAFPEFRLSRRSDTERIQRQEATMLVIETKTLEKRDPSGPEIRMAAALDEVVLAVAWHREGERTAAVAAALAAAGGARLTILSIVDSTLIDAPTAVPIGGAHYARRLARTRLAQARDRAASSARLAAQQAAALGLQPVVHHVEGKPAPGHFACDRQRSVIVMPAGGWFDHGVVLTEDKAAAAQLGLDATPLLMPRGAAPRFDRLLVLHDGGDASSAAIERLADHPLLAGRDVAIAGIGRCSEAALNAAASRLGGRGHRLEIAGRFPGRDDAEDLAERLTRADVVVASRALLDASWTSIFGMGTWRIVRRTDRSVLLI